MPQAGINDERDFSANVGSGQDILGETANRSGDPAQEIDGTSQTTQERSNDELTGEEGIGAKPQTQELSDEKKSEILDEYVKAALADNILGFNALTIKAKYPKAYQAAVNYMSEKGQIPADDETAIGVFLYTPRSLFYEFFDSKKLFINIHGSDTRWKYSYEPNESSDPFTSRIEAEYNGFLDGFERLEQL